MKYLIRRQKAGAVAFVSAVVAGQVAGLTPDQAAAHRFNEAEAKDLMARLHARVKHGRWAVLDEKGAELGAFGEEDPPEPPQAIAVSDLDEPADPPAADLFTLDTLDPASPFRELHALLGLTGPPESTTLHAVAAAALHELKEMIAGARQADAETTNDAGTPAAA